MKRWLLIFAALFGFAKVNAQTENYFPLAIGNQWEYYDGVKYWFGEIEKDTLYKNGKKYFIMPFSIGEFHFARKDSLGNVYTIESMFNPYHYDSLEALVFKSNAQLGESWVVSYSGPPLYDTVKSTCHYVGMGNVFGESRNIKGISIDNGTIPMVNLYFAEGIGLIKEEYDDGTVKLIDYAKIGGIRFGKLLDVQKIDKMPDVISISQNYPNPFNSRTSIEVQIPSNAGKPAPLDFIIYDILGRVIVRKNYLVTNNQTNIKIDIDADALKLTSGTYFYSVTIGNTLLTKKMAYLK
ncbi:MAG: T9SS type A sorting domain-containing protein [Bacteroidota bacterium]|nr:T9SS type A sorting domain-containing protein [Bacteroidota bacterium]MDP4197280.1 T9SS type A sorting domain-containing protein [Bacteroidota bacterium]